MSHNIIYITLYLLSITITSGLPIAQQEPNNTITLEALPKVTKGFPVVIKVNVKGPHTVSYTSIFDNNICITVHLISMSDGKKYSINSFGSITRLYLSTAGGDISKEIIKGVPFLVVTKEQKYSMIFDLWSLSPRNATGNILIDVPAGKYSMHVEFLKVPAGEYNINNAPNTDKVNSDSIDIELVEPNEQEKQFIQKIQDSASDLLIAKDRIGVSWIKFLQDGMQISNDDMSKLTHVSKKQLSFHKLISDVNIVDEHIRNESIEKVNRASLPEFLEPERQLLLLELKGNPEKERDDLLQKYPQLHGMVEKLDSGNNTFLKYKKSAILRDTQVLPQESN